jgi:hypothetical protein
MEFSKPQSLCGTPAAPGVVSPVIELRDYLDRKWNRGEERIAPGVRQSFWSLPSDNFIVTVELRITHSPSASGDLK